MTGNSNDETNFLRKLLLTNTQVVNLRKAFVGKSSTDIKLSKAQLSKMIQSQEFLGRLLGQIIKTLLPLIENLIKTLTKLILLGLTAAVSAADERIHKKALASAHPSDSTSYVTTLKISNDKMEDIMETVKSLENSGLLLKGVRKKEDFVVCW